LAAHFPELDRDKLIRFSLVHDLVEIHAGDTYIYGPQEHLDSKEDREAAALKQLTNDWPDFPELAETITEYEHRECKESQFIYALDKIMPMMQIYLNEGHTWQKHGIELVRVDQTKRSKVVGSPEISAYYEELRKLFEAQPDLFASPK
jgi:putative hydrolase of HD superfamily